MYFTCLSWESGDEILHLEKRVFPADRRAKICENLVLADLFKALAASRQEPVFEAGDFGANLHPHAEKLRQEFCLGKRKSSMIVNFCQERESRGTQGGVPPRYGQDVCRNDQHEFVSFVCGATVGSWLLFVTTQS